MASSQPVPGPSSQNEDPPLRDADSDDSDNSTSETPLSPGRVSRIQTELAHELPTEQKARFNAYMKMLREESFDDPALTDSLDEMIKGKTVIWKVFKKSAAHAEVFRQEIHKVQQQRLKAFH